MLSKRLRRMHTKIKVVLVTLVLCTMCACSVSKLLGDNEKRDAPKKAAVIQVSVQYLKLCFLNNIKSVYSYLSIPMYYGNQGLNMDQYKLAVRDMARAWPVAEHPLIYLTFTGVEVDGDDAVVRFKREPESKKFPEVEIRLVWTTSSWRIIDDNIFGQNEIFDSRSK